MTKTSIFQPGLRAFRTYGHVILALQGCAAIFVLAYFGSSSLREFCGHLQQLKEKGGLFFSALSTLFAAGILPEIIKLKFRPAGLRKPSGGELFHQMSFFVLVGLLVDVFYRLQGTWFGQGHDWKVLLPKLFVDQFVFSPFISAPFSVSWFLWREHGYRPHALLLGWTPRYFVERALPIWFAALIYWFPLLIAVYALPSALQFVAFLFISCAWSILFIFMARRFAEAAPPTHGDDSCTGSAKR